MIKKIVGYIGKFLIILLIAIGVFYFWASSANLDISEYQKIESYSVDPGVINDSIYTIATYNIGYLSGMTNNTAADRPQSLFDQNLKKVQQVFKKLNIDIVALQEIDYDASRSYHIDQQKRLSEIGYPYAARAVNWDKKYVPFPYLPFSSHFGKIISGQSIVSRFPIEEHERMVLSRVENDYFWRQAFYIDRLAQVISLTINGQKVKIINVHAEAFDAPTREKHLKTVADIYKKYASEYPTFLLGDFNTDPGKEKMLHHILEVGDIKMAETDLSQQTFPADHPEKRIDFIFYNPSRIEKVNARVLKEVEVASDHLPVMMRFKLQ